MIYEPVKNSLKPRERLAKYGAGKLTDEELVAVMLGSGMKGMPVYQLAKRVVGMLDKHGFEAGNGTGMRLNGISGIGTAKAALLEAALEFARRRLCPERRRITRPSDIVPYVTHYADRKQEHFLCLSLNGAHEIIALRVVSIGLVNSTVVHPREVYADPLTDRAASVICAHNHPSGNLEPSKEDEEITIRLKLAGETLGITLLDHIVFTVKGYYSFLEAGRLG